MSMPFLPPHRTRGYVRLVLSHEAEHVIHAGEAEDIADIPCDEPRFPVDLDDPDGGVGGSVGEGGIARDPMRSCGKWASFRPALTSRQRTPGTLRWRWLWSGPAR